METSQLSTINVIKKCKYLIIESTRAFELYKYLVLV